MSQDDLVKLKKQLQDELEALERKIEADRPRLMAEYVESIRSHCAMRDWPIAEVCAMLKLSAEKPDGRKAVRHYVHTEDSSKVYRGRVLPKWMRADMEEKGFDPASKEDRDAYRSGYMVEVA